MTLAGFKFNFPFQVDVATGKQSEFYVLIDGTDGKSKLRMFHNNLVRGMSLPDLSAVCKECIIVILVRDGAAYMSLITSITDIRSPVKPVAAFPYKILAVLVAGSTFDITKDNLSTDIFLLAMETVDTKIFGIQEEPSSRIVIGQAVCTDLFGYRAWVFAEMACNLFERDTIIQGTFYVKPVRSGKMFMVTRNIFTHDVSFRCCQGQEHHNIYAELNSTCAEVTSIRKKDSRVYFCNLGVYKKCKK